MVRHYDVIFKLPCEKVFTFNIIVCGDYYDPTTEVGNHPSQHMLDYYLYYVQQLQNYSGEEISNGTVVSVSLKKNDEPKRKNINAYTETESEHKEEPTPSFKSLYWKNGYIVKTRGNGYGIISNDLIFCENGSIYKSVLDESLISNPISCPGNANDIIEVWDNSAICGFNPYSAEDIHRYCHLVWTRPIEMSLEEIERKLNLRKGSLVIID